MFTCGISSIASVLCITPSLGTVSSSGPAPLCGTLQSSWVPFLQNELLKGTHTDTGIKCISIGTYSQGLKGHLYFVENMCIVSEYDATNRRIV